MDKHFANDQTEISLVDIGVAFWQHRRVFIGVWLSTIVLAFVAASLIPPSYGYSTTIQIGGVPGENGGLNLIESADTVAAKFRSVYVPELAAKHERQASVTGLDVEVSVPKGAATVELSAKGPLALSGIYGLLLKELAARLSSDHQRVLQAQEARLNADRSELIAKRTDLASKREAVADELQRIAETKILLSEQVKALNAVISEYLSQASAIRTNGDVSSKALTLLLLNDSIEDAMRNRLELEERIQSDLPNRASELKAEMATLAAQVDAVSAEIERVDVSIDGLRNTKAIAEPITSREPVGLHRVQLLVLISVVGALIAAVIVAGVLFVKSVRRHLLRQAVIDGG